MTSTKTHPIQLLAFDADDTLWVNEPFYREVEATIEALLRPYLDADNFIDQLYEREIRNLGIFGYGAKGFTLSLVETAIELSEGRVSAPEIHRIIELGKSLLTKPIEILPGVEKTIKHLSADFKLMIITKGDLFDQESKIARSGLAEYFDYVEIVNEKKADVYAGILKQYGVQARHFLMVGNSLKSDILPVVEIGARAIHIPFHTTWVHEEIAAQDAAAQQYQTLSGITDLITLLRDKGNSW